MSWDKPVLHTQFIESEGAVAPEFVSKCRDPRSLKPRSVSILRAFAEVIDRYWPPTQDDAIAYGDNMPMN